MNLARPNAVAARLRRNRSSDHPAARNTMAATVAEGAAVEMLPLPVQGYAQPIQIAIAGRFMGRTAALSLSA